MKPVNLTSSREASLKKKKKKKKKQRWLGLLRKKYQSSVIKSAQSTSAALWKQHTHVKITV